jgi:hypothetical protein
MKKSRDTTLAVLKDIRSEIRQTNASVGALRTEMHHELGALREETREGLSQLSRRIVETELRTATAITDLAGTVRDMTGVLRAQGDLRPRLERCEQDIAELKRRPPQPS